jgi:hypothetical protein
MSQIRCTMTCYSPMACNGWGYCRNRNIQAGGMDNVTAAMQDEWKRMDSYGDVWGVYAANNDLRASFQTNEEAVGYIQEQPEGFCGLSVYRLGEFS